jgi:hypothetical protein
MELTAASLGSSHLDRRKTGPGECRMFVKPEARPGMSRVDRERLRFVQRGRDRSVVLGSCLSEAC